MNDSEYEVKAEVAVAPETQTVATSELQLVDGDLPTIVAHIHQQREAILTAFLAEMQCLPSECEQVVIQNPDGTVQWFVRKSQSTHVKPTT